LNIDPLNTIDDPLGARVQCNGQQSTWSWRHNCGHIEVSKDLLHDDCRPNMLTECVKEALRIIPAKLLLYERSEGSDIRGLGLLNSREGSRSTDSGVDAQRHDTLFREGPSHTGGELRVMMANLPG
jgi:hypothetical protein